MFPFLYYFYNDEYVSTWFSSQLKVNSSFLLCIAATDPSKVENSQRLDNFLTQRPDAQELVDKNILKGCVSLFFCVTLWYTETSCILVTLIDPKVAPAIQQQRDELSKARIQDTLRHKIDHRPTREELVEHHILGK